MFLSRVELATGAATGAAFWSQVAQPYGAHQALWRLFSRSPDQTRDFLYRAEEVSGRPTFLVLSAERPADGEKLWRIETKPFEPSLRSGQRLGFRLRASPVVRRRKAGAGEGTRGQRHDVVMDHKKRLAVEGRPFGDEAALIRDAGLAWLERQAVRSGIRLATARHEAIGEDGLLEADAHESAAVRVDGYRQHRIARRGEKAITFSSIDFEGVLEVTDPAALIAQVRAGFGPQKAFGCGLMLLRRA